MSKRKFMLESGGDSCAAACSSRAAIDGPSVARVAPVSSGRSRSSHG